MHTEHETLYAIYSTKPRGFSPFLQNIRSRCQTDTFESMLCCNSAKKGLALLLFSVFSHGV